MGRNYGNDKHGAALVRRENGRSNNVTLLNRPCETQAHSSIVVFSNSIMIRHSLPSSSVLKPVDSSALQSHATAVREKAQVEATKGAAEDRAGNLGQEAERLHVRSQELESQVAKLNRVVDEAKLQENRLADRVFRLEVSSYEIQHLQESPCPSGSYIYFFKCCLLTCLAWNTLLGQAIVLICNHAFFFLPA